MRKKNILEKRHSRTGNAKFNSTSSGIRGFHCMFDYVTGLEM